MRRNQQQDTNFQPDVVHMVKELSFDGDDNAYRVMVARWKDSSPPRVYFQRYHGTDRGGNDVWKTVAPTFEQWQKITSAAVTEALKAATAEFAGAQMKREDKKATPSTRGAVSLSATDERMNRLEETVGTLAQGIAALLEQQKPKGRKAAAAAAE